MAMTHPSRSADKLPRVVSGVDRERETFKYEPFLPSESRINDSGRPFPSSDLASSRDCVMTALAQLGTYQTGTDRAFISLFDASYQYIVAEATPLTPLTPSLPSDKCPAPLIHCGTAIPRDHGICEDALRFAANPRLDQAVGPAELPVSVAADWESDGRFASRPFFRLGDSYQFYAIVPVRTRTGIDIGTYCVFNHTQPADWNERCAQSLRDVSEAIMEHLVTQQSKHAYRRNERINQGLGSLIERKATFSGPRSRTNTAAYPDDSKSEMMVDVKQHPDHQADQAKGNEFPVENPSAGSEGTTIESPHGSVTDRADQPSEAPRGHDSRHRPSNMSSGGKGSHVANAADAGRADPGGNSTAQIFSEAAETIRESFEVTGCIFFDVTLGSYRPMAEPLGDPDTSSEAGEAFPASSSEDDASTSMAEYPDTPSDVLGFSLSEVSSGDESQVLGTELVITKWLLARLLRHYPNGMIFNFDARGQLQSSDLFEAAELSDSLSDAPQTQETMDDSDGTAGIQEEHTPNQSARLREAAMVRKAFPAARSVAFVPIWNSKRERWFAGGFMYTVAPTRIFSVETELSIFKAFGNIIAADVHHLEAQQVDTAKTDVLGSVSHELRSPLHGIILNTELLMDTDLSVFQNSAAHTIETCCRTMLDTIDHLLDYSRVTGSGAKQQRNSDNYLPKTGKRIKESRLDNKALHTHVRLDGLVEEVMNSMFAGFNFQYMSVRKLSKADRPRWADAGAHNRLDGADAMEQLDIAFPGGQDAHRAPLGEVLVYVSIDPACDWMFYAQAGAIRRILMNLFGNSLKYTDRGSIYVTLRQEVTSSQRSRALRTVELVVKDTGKGIGEDFLTHKLFTPFSQEDELASGTGLGLSIVKTTVSQLGGRINVESKVAVGTTITVKLPLVQSSEMPGTIGVSSDDKAFADDIQEVAGMRIQIVGFESIDDKGSIRGGWGVVEDICRRWLRLDVLTKEQTRLVVPDVVLWLDDSLQSSTVSVEQPAKAPNIVICKDPFAAYQRFRMHESTGHGGVFEYITQPVGPRKLAKSIQLAYERWMGISRRPVPLRRQAPMRSHSSPLLGTGARASVETQHPLATAASVSTEQIPTPSREDAEQAEAHEPSQPPAAQEERPPSVPGEAGEEDTVKKILLVDDNHINLRVLSAYMGKLGQAYETAMNGQEAVNTYIQGPERFVGILMDISMPVMDGLEATRKIRAFEHQTRCDPVVILALTGLATDDARQESERSGVDVFLTKPVKLGLLHMILDSRNVLRGPSLAHAI